MILVIYVQGLEWLRVHAYEIHPWIMGCQFTVRVERGPREAGEMESVCDSGDSSSLIIHY